MKVLLFDLESFPNLVYTWGIYEQNAIKVVRHRMVCSIAWKWLGDSKTQVVALPDFPEYRTSKFTNRSLMKVIRDLLNEADIAVAHNIDQFDLKRSKTDMVKVGLKPLNEFRTIDTLKIARQKFGFNSNSLGALCDYLGIPGKVKHEGFPLWEACMEGDLKAWKKMKEYNVGDVDPCLEGVYKVLSPWYRPRWLSRMEQGEANGRKESSL